MGVYSALHCNSWLSHLFMTVSLMGVSLPHLPDRHPADPGLIRGAGLAAVLRLGRETAAIGWWSTGLLTGSGLKALIVPSITLGLFQ